MTEEEHDAKLRAEAQALREEVAEYEALCNRQAELLSQSIVAIRGPEPELTRWGYADLPLRVKTIVEEVAALRARVVVPDGYAIVPVELTRDMWVAVNKEDDRAYAGACDHGAQFDWLWKAAIDAAPNLNGKAVSEGLLRRIVTPALTSSDAHDRIGALEELRALLSEQA
ncbi:hypothetical protein [Pseudomonas aeruginosa]|uniref:hypothetical protein n=1 Tax=Pseudomonas aeruginosa TaxID=287 RepID=UPI001C131657|nr:hypothetical protein [Pseudomonas aeruginosa]